MLENKTTINDYQLQHNKFRPTEMKDITILRSIYHFRIHGFFPLNNDVIKAEN